MANRTCAVIALHLIAGLLLGCGGEGGSPPPDTAPDDGSGLPASDLITGVTFDFNTLVRRAEGSDNWAITWADEFFTGLDSRGTPGWSSDIGERAAVFSDPENGVMLASVTCNAGPGRYLLLTQQRSIEPGGYIGIYDSDAPWGPWRKVLFEDAWELACRTAPCSGREETPTSGTETINSSAIRLSNSISRKVQSKTFLRMKASDAPTHIHAEAVFPYEPAKNSYGDAKNQHDD